jgi:hypothetical protein
MYWLVGLDYNTKEIICFAIDLHYIDHHSSDS